MATHDSRWPKTLDEAANWILANMSAEDLGRVRRTKRADLDTYHHGWGRAIRNAFGLWNGNTALLESSGCVHPDECSMRIIERVWEQLQVGSEPEAE
jgi:hypothetical protein